MACLTWPNNMPFYSWLHIELVKIAGYPISTYFLDRMTIEGSVLPALISTGLLLKYWRQVKDQQIIIGFLLFAVTMGLFTQY